MTQRRCLQSLTFHEHTRQMRETQGQDKK